MMMAGAGGKTVVRGSRMAIPEVGPMPGSTPTRVPIRLPMRAKKRLYGVRAFAKPCPRSSQEKSMRSMTFLLAGV